MRILHILGDSKYGGGSVIVARLCEAARQNGWTPFVLTTDPHFQEYLRERKIGVVTLDVIWRQVRLGRDIKGILKLAQWLRKNKFDLVHTHTSKAGVAGRIAARLAGVPAIVHTVHGFAFHEESTLRETALMVGAERFASLWCDRVVTVSDFHKEVAIQHRIAPQHKIYAIPNGVPPELVLTSGRANSEVRAEFGLGDNDVMILTTGRLAEQKGKRYLLDAIPILLANSNRRFKVIVPGDGPLAEVLQTQTKNLSIERYVDFIGFRDDLPDLIAASDIVVLPSLWEGLSIALLEAMAARKAVVTTEIGSNLEVVTSEESAILVPAKDPNALAHGILRLIADPELRERLANNALARYMDRYTEARMLSDYLELYGSLQAASPGDGVV